MATYEQKPGVLNVSLNRGDEFGILLDIDRDVTGYTFSAAVYSLVDSSTVASPTLTVSNAALGQVNLSLTEAQTALLGVGSYGLRVTWVQPGSVQRTAIDGGCEVKA